MFSVLSLTTDKLQLVSTTTGALSLDVHVSYVDVDTSGNQLANKQNTNITSGTTTDIKASPAANTTSNVKYVSVVNSGTTTATAKALYNANGTTYQLTNAITLLSGESIVLREGTPFHLDTNMGVYGVGQTFATQADMEAATSLVLVASPGVVQYHPGVAKVVGYTIGTAAPVLQTPPGYNCTITDTGVGQLTINFTKSFSSSTAYAVLSQVEIISTTLTASTNCMQSFCRFGAQTSAASIQINCCDRAATTNIIRDPISWHFAVFGDQ